MTKLLVNKKIFVCVLIVIIVFVCSIVFRDKFLKTIYPKSYENLVKVYSELYDVEDILIFAVIKAESNFDEDVISNKGAIGLMQLMENTAKDVANKYDIKLEVTNVRQDLLRPEVNINIGSKYLAILLDRYKCKEVALAAYNAGIGTVDNWIKKDIIKADGSDIENIPYKETNNYVRKILRDYVIYEELYG